MPLDEYRRKRDFGATPEPDGGAAPAGAAPSFVIQKHAARALHYDVRLQVGDVLVSWAVPKGPSLDTADKRLAVHVEDHPLDYGGFEGTIPEGEYGGGTVMVWDRGTWELLGGAPDATDPQAAIGKGHLKFRLSGTKLRGAWALVRMKPREGEKRENWLLIKERDESVRPRADYDVLAGLPDSALTGRTMEAIARGDAAPADTGRGPGAPDGAPAATDPGLDTGPGAPLPPDPAALDGSRPAPMPERVAPQLATLVDAPPDGDEWLHEVKLDGYRAIVLIRDGSARVMTRGGKDWTERFAPIADAAARLPAREAVLDGEIVVLRADGVSDFGELQAELAGGHTSRLLYFAFDLLHLDGYDLTGVPLVVRKGALSALLDVAAPAAPTPLRYTDHIAGSGATVRDRSCELALEGVVSKRADAPYRPGRTRAWLKTKCLARQEFVVAGFTDPEGARAGFGALVLGTFGEDETLEYAGRVGTGFAERDLSALRRALDPLVVATSPFPEVPAAERRGAVSWVRPELVVEVAFAGHTREGLLRHASFKGLREDKPAREVRTERVTTGEVGGGVPGVTADAGAADPRTGPVTVAGAVIGKPAKVLFAGIDVTKLELARYYQAVAPRMLPFVSGRLLSLVRCPHGDLAGCFFQKHVEPGASAFVHTTEVVFKDGPTLHPWIDDVGGLVTFAHWSTLEIHCWGALAADPDHPDVLVLDLDPDPGLPFGDVMDAARLVRARVESLGLVPFVKTTGGKGLHVVVPIVPSVSWPEAEAVARAIAEDIAKDSPTRYTTSMSKAKRVGRIFIDYVRNTRGSTSVAPYSTRARPGAVVAMPVRWEDLTPGLEPGAFTVRTVPALLASMPDPWAGFAAAARPVLPVARDTLGG